MIEYKRGNEEKEQFNKTNGFQTIYSEATDTSIAKFLAMT